MYLGIPRYVYEIEAAKFSQQAEPREQANHVVPLSLKISQGDDITQKNNPMYFKSETGSVNHRKF